MLHCHSEYKIKKMGGGGKSNILILKCILYLLFLGFVFFLQYSSCSMHFTALGVKFIWAYSKLSFYLHKIGYLSPQVMIMPSFPALSLVMLMLDGTTLH